MLSSDEYEKLKPERDAIFKFCRHEINHYDFASIWEAMDHTMQRRGSKPLCYDCEGSKIQLLTDIYNLMVEYEQANGTAN